MSKPIRNITFVDQLIQNFDQVLRTFNHVDLPSRSNPSDPIDSPNLSSKQQKKARAYMRVNHSGEISAQALYQGQALFSRDERTKEFYLHAAQEENDHLIWCQERVHQLNGKTSYLTPVWYLGSFALGASFSLLGDKWSLGFLAETEHQVVQHLESHLNLLPEEDYKSRTIVEQMIVDENAHATSALDYGGAELPMIVKTVMKATSKIMTISAYYV